MSEWATRLNLGDFELRNLSCEEKQIEREASMRLQHSRMVCYKIISAFWLTVILSIGLGPGLHAAGIEKAKSPIPGAESGNYGLQYERSILTGIGLEDVFRYNDEMTT